MATAEATPTQFRPEDLAAQRFSLARRGYDPHEVHAFLKQVVEHINRLQGEIEWRRARTEHLERRAGSGHETAYARLARDFVEVVRTADQAALRVKGAAEEEARAVLNSAHLEADRILVAARDEARSILVAAAAEAGRPGQDAGGAAPRLYVTGPPAERLREIWAARGAGQPPADLGPADVPATAGPGPEWHPYTNPSGSESFPPLRPIDGDYDLNIDIDLPSIDLDDPRFEP